MREATKADRPRVAEAQCVLCWRMFRSDGAAERHKPYRAPITADCKDPAMIGMTPQERRSLAVWGIPMPPDVLAALRGERREES